jgi:cobalamin biosynthesis Co2+ chelatase CbiK
VIVAKQEHFSATPTKKHFVAAPPLSLSKPKSVTAKTTIVMALSMKTSPAPATQAVKAELASVLAKTEHNNVSTASLKAFVEVRFFLPKRSAMEKTTTAMEKLTMLLLVGNPHRKNSLMQA